MLYKYRSFDDYKFEQIFEDGLLYFSRPEQFNDPFESKPRIVGIDTLEERQDYVKDHIARNCVELGYAKRKKLERTLLTRLTDQEVIRENIHSIFNKYGILCMSKRWDQILMWSHYAKSHQGICIGIDFSHDLDDDYGVVHDVIYNQNYPEVNLGTFGNEDPDSLKELLEVTMQTKSTDWSYEEEVRFIKLQVEGGPGTYPFKKEKIKEIILGACISDEDREKILRLARRHSPEAQVFQAQLSDKTYSVERVERPLG